MWSLLSKQSLEKMSAANQQIIQSIMQTGYTPTNLGTLLVNACTDHYSKKILTLLCKIKKKWNPKTTFKIELREFTLKKSN